MTATEGLFKKTPDYGKRPGLKPRIVKRREVGKKYECIKSVSIKKLTIIIKKGQFGSLLMVSETDGNEIGYNCTMERQDDCSTRFQCLV